MTQELANEKGIKVDAEGFKKEFEKYLYTKEQPDVDLLIRTSGEIRISNYLLWQIAYAELFFTDTLWPDFTADKLDKILDDFQNRDRRFGAV